MRDIISVEVYLDDDVPEYMEGILRIGGVKYEFEDIEGQFEDFEEAYDDEDPDDVQAYFNSIDFVDNAEFHNEKNLIDYVAKKLHVSSDIISVIN